MLSFCPFKIKFALRFGFGDKKKGQRYIETDLQSLQWQMAALRQFLAILFCQLHEYLSQNWVSDDHFEVGWTKLTIWGIEL